MNSDSYSNQMMRICEAQQGSKHALESILDEYRSLVEMLARRVRCHAIGIDELIQAGNLGLIYAIKHYDASYGAKLITYAVPWILGEMRREIRAMQCVSYSLDQPIDGENLTLYDILAGTQAPDIGGVDLRLALSQLSGEEQILICLRYYRGNTQKETAVILEKSQAQISRMESRILNKLHTQLS